MEMVLSGLVVITGASGFIGRECVRRLDGPVRGLVRLLDVHTVARKEFVSVGDLMDADARVLANALHGANAVVHLAGHAHRTASTAALRRVNVDMSERLARAAATARVAHFVFASSVKVNGEMSLPGHPLRESDPPNPQDDYAASKWAAERALEGVAEDTGLRVTLLRLPLCYGPGAKANFAALTRAVQRGVPLPLEGIENRRSVLSTGNFCDALRVLLASDPAADRGRATPYFVADAQSISIPDLVRAIAHALRVAPRLFRVPPALLRIAAAAAGRSEAVERLLTTLEVDTDAFRTRFAWSPARTLEQSLSEALAHAPSL
jgi:nucleoside-diphosphate-sugar epimerase